MPALRHRTVITNGITMHYAPLAWITDRGAKTELRLTFGPLTTAAAAPRRATRRSSG